MRDRISVIIPVFNGERFIRDSLESLAAQSRRPDEVFVADDKSTDRTLDVVRDFANCAPFAINVVQMEKNTGGPNEPAVVAYKRTTGNLVCILDADDLFTDDAFATYIAMFDGDSNRHIGLATSDFATFRHGSEETISPSFFARHESIMRGVFEKSNHLGTILQREEAIGMLSRAFVLPFKGMLRREAWDAVNGPNLKYRIVCDCDFIWRLVAHTNFVVKVINKPLVRVRVSSESLSTQRRVVSIELIDLFRKMLSDVEKPSHRREMARRIENELFDVAYADYKSRAYLKLIPSLLRYAMARALRVTWGKRKSSGAGEN